MLMSCSVCRARKLRARLPDASTDDLRTAHLQKRKAVVPARPRAASVSQRRANAREPDEAREPERGTSISSASGKLGRRSDVAATTMDEYKPSRPFRTRPIVLAVAAAAVGVYWNPCSIGSGVSGADIDRMRHLLARVKESRDTEGGVRFLPWTIEDKLAVMRGRNLDALLRGSFDVAAPDGRATRLDRIGFQAKAGDGRYFVWDIVTLSPRDVLPRLALVDFRTPEPTIIGAVRIPKDLPRGVDEFMFPEVFRCGEPFLMDLWGTGGDPMVGSPGRHVVYRVDPTNDRIECLPLDFWNKGWKGGGWFRDDVFKSMEVMFHDSATDAIFGVGDHYAPSFSPYPYVRRYRL
jgi:hypothetical protein